MHSVDKNEYEYFSCCEILATQLYEYSNILSGASLI